MRWCRPGRHASISRCSRANQAGVETLVRDEYSEIFTNQVVAPQEWSATAPAAGALLATDRLVVKLYAQRVLGPTTVTVTTFYEGTAHTSLVQTTISAGVQGPPGPGVPSGGTTDQILAKASAADYATKWVAAPSGGGGGSVPALVSALPASPVDGQEIYYQNADMLAKGIRWHFAYSAAKSWWEFVGGPVWMEGPSPTIASAAVTNTTAAGGVDLGGPQITTPLDGDYEMSISVRAQGPGVTVKLLSAMGASPYGGSASGYVQSSSSNVTTLQQDFVANLVKTGVMKLRVTNLGAGSGSNSQFSEGRISIRPVKVTP